VGNSSKEQKSKPGFYSDFEGCDCRSTTTLGSGEKEKESLSACTRLAWDDKDRLRAGRERSRPNDWRYEFTSVTTLNVYCTEISNNPCKFELEQFDRNSAVWPDGERSASSNHVACTSVTRQSA